MAEDLTTYTEVDGPGVLTVTSTRVTALNADDDQTYYVYKDFGVGFFNGFDINFEIYMDALSLGSGRLLMGLANSINNWAQWGVTTVGVTFEANAGTPNEIELWRGYIGGVDTYTNAQDATIYYCSLKRTADSDTVTLEIYSDSNRQNLVDILSVVGYGSGTRYRYFYAAASAGSGIGGRDFDGYNQNFDIIPIPVTGKPIFW